jgi:hypothetical protein
MILNDRRIELAAGGNSAVGACSENHRKRFQKHGL